MITKDIIESALEMYTGFYNFTDDDERESKQEKESLSPIKINIEHSPNRCYVNITHIGIILFEADLVSSIEGKKSMEEQALRKILNDIIIHGFSNMCEKKGMQPQMKSKQKWMIEGTEVRIGAKEGVITSTEDRFIDGKYYVYYIYVQIFDTKKPKQFPPGIVSPINF